MKRFIACLAIVLGSTVGAAVSLQSPGLTLSADHHWCC
jgi:hypothetical protein